MSKTKKIVSVIIAVAIAIGIFSTLAFALSDNAVLSLSADKTALVVGESVKVTVSLKTDFYTASMIIPVHYDKTALTAKSVEFKGWVGNSANSEAFADMGDGVVILNSAVKSDALAIKFKNENLAVITFEVVENKAGNLVYLDASDKRTPQNPTGALAIGSYQTSDPSSEMTYLDKNISLMNAFASFDRNAFSSFLTYNFATKNTDNDKTDLRIYTRFSQAEAAESFGIPANTVASGDLGTDGIVKIGTIVAKASYLAENSLASLTLADVDSVDVFDVKSTHLYNDNATAEGDGFYYYAMTVKDVAAVDWNTEIYAVGYITYMDGAVSTTVYGAGYSTIISVELA